MRFLKGSYFVTILDIELKSFKIIEKQQKSTTKIILNIKKNLLIF